MTALASRGQLRASLLRWALFIVPALVLLGFLSGQMAGSGPGNIWFDNLIKPDIFPPPAWFGIVWTILYIMMGISLAIICASWGARGRTAAIIAFAAQFALNLAWSPVFFGWHQLTSGLFVIGLLNVVLAVTLILFWKVRRSAALLLIPYLAWTLFATALNYEFLRLNPEADGAEASPPVERFEI